MKRKLLSILVVCIFFIGPVSAQLSDSEKARIKKIYDEAESLYKAGNYSASITYLTRESGTLLNASDSLQYLKIKNLENIYGTDFGLTVDLESTLKQFFNKVNKYSFPELKYDEVTRIYTVFESFKERDKAFYDSVTRVLDINKIEALPLINKTTSDYLKAYPNSYYSKELNGYLGSISNKMNELEAKRQKHILDSTFRVHLLLVGKHITMTLSYSVPSGNTAGSTGNFSGIHNSNDVETFFSGKYTGSLGERYALNVSLGDAFINVYTGTRVKGAISWSVLDAEYNVFDWKLNDFLFDKQSNGSAISNLQSIRAGTRVGPIVAFMLTKRIAAALYYNARPGIQFLMHTSYYSTNNGTTTNSYSVKPVISNYNLSNEIGLRFYFFERLYIGPYFHSGNYTWQNDLTDISNGGSQRLKTNYKFKYIGIRIGF